MRTPFTSTTAKDRIWDCAECRRTVLVYSALELTPASRTRAAAVAATARACAHKRAHAEALSSECA